MIDPKGGPVSGARVAVDRPGKVALTTADGRFALHGIRPGTRSLYVRRIGYQPVEVPIDVKAESPGQRMRRLFRRRNALVRRGSRGLHLAGRGWCNRSLFLGVHTKPIQAGRQSLRDSGCLDQAEAPALLIFIPECEIQ